MLATAAWAFDDSLRRLHKADDFIQSELAMSIRDNLKARRLIQSPWYQERWGHLIKLSGDQNAKQRFENDRTGYRLATSVGGTATGEGGSRLILDDPHSAQEAQSDTIRTSALPPTVHM